MYNVNRTFFKSFLVVCVLAWLLSLTDNEHHVDMSVLEYKQNLEYVSELADYGTNRHCLHGAALVLSGDYKSAEEYMTVYGSCIRSLVSRTQMGQQLHVVDKSQIARMK